MIPLLDIRSSPAIKEGTAVLVGDRIAYVHPDDFAKGAEHIALLPVTHRLPEQEPLHHIRWALPDEPIEMRLWRYTFWSVP